MNSLGEIEEHILCERLMKKWFIMDYIQVVVYKLLLERPVIALNNAVNLRSAGIYKQMGNGSFLSCFIEFPQMTYMLIGIEN